MYRDRNSMSEDTHEEKLNRILGPLSRIKIEAYQRFANEAKSIEVSKSEDGKGLSTGADIDYHLVNGFLPDELGDDFERYSRTLRERATQLRAKTTNPLSLYYKFKHNTGQG